MTPADRCRAEIKYVERKLQAGHPDVQMLKDMLRDLSEELRLMEHPAEASQ